MTSFKKLIIILIVLVLGAVALLAQSGKLTRGRAKTLISQSLANDYAVTEEISLGTDFRRADYMRLIRWDLADDLVAHSYLRKEGNVYAIGPEGEKLESGWGRLPGNKKSRLIPVANRKALAVTGITMLDEGTAQVEYTWEYVWTSIGAQIAETGQHSGARLRARYGNGDVHEGNAIFRKRDDGWRLLRLSFN